MLTRRIYLPRGRAHCGRGGVALEQYAQPEDILAGFDLADYFIRRDLEFGWAMKEEGYPVFWDGKY